MQTASRSCILDIPSSQLPYPIAFPCSPSISLSLLPPSPLPAPSTVLALPAMSDSAPPLHAREPSGLSLGLSPGLDDPRHWRFRDPRSWDAPIRGDAARFRAVGRGRRRQQQQEQQLLRLLRSCIAHPFLLASLCAAICVAVALVHDYSGWSLSVSLSLSCTRTWTALRDMGHLAVTGVASVAKVLTEMRYVFPEYVCVFVLCAAMVILRGGKTRNKRGETKKKKGDGYQDSLLTPTCHTRQQLSVHITPLLGPQGLERINDLDLDFHPFHLKSTTHDRCDNATSADIHSAARIRDQRLPFQHVPGHLDGRPGCIPPPSCC